MIETIIGAGCFILGYLLGSAVSKKALHKAFKDGAEAALNFIQKELAKDGNKSANVIPFKSNRDKD